MDILHYLNVACAPAKAALPPGAPPLFAKYAPTTMCDLATFLPAGVSQQVLDWMRSVVSGSTTRNTALLVGPSGSMKGLLVQLAATELHREAISLQNMTADPTLASQRGHTLVVFAHAMDALDGASIDKVREFAKTWPRIPLLLFTCSEVHGKVIELSRATTVFRLGPPSPASLAAFAGRILAGEGLDPALAQQLVAACSPDFYQVANTIAFNRGAKGIVAFTKDPRIEAMTVLTEHMFARCRPHMSSTFHAFLAEGGLFSPLVAENYIDAAGDIHTAAAAADDLSAADAMEACMYELQAWSLLDPWVFRASVLPCHRVARHVPGHKPRFSKLWSLYSNASQRNGRLVAVRNGLATKAGTLHPCLDLGMSVASMLWCMLEGGDSGRAAQLTQESGVSPLVAHHLARMAGRGKYKAAHQRALVAACSRR
jgi:hypothetical protein